jgi:hypothetical protein
MTEIERNTGARKPPDEIFPGKFGPPIEIGVVARAGAGWKDWAALIAASHRSNVEQFLHTGRLITAAKAALPHGEFGELIEALPFSTRMAQIYMAVAADARITNAKHISHLPAHIGTLYEITKLDDAQFDARIADGTIRPDMQRRDIATAIKQPPEKRAGKEGKKYRDAARHARGAEAIRTHVHDALSMLFGLPPAHEVAAYFANTDVALLIAERLPAVLAWLQDFRKDFSGEAQPSDGPAYCNEATPILLAPPTTLTTAAGGGDDPRLEGDGLDIPAFLRRTAEAPAVVP